MSEQITLSTGRKVWKGLIPTSRHMLMAARPAPILTAPPASCFNSNGTIWDMDANDRLGDCVSVYLANWLEMVCGCKIPEANVIAWARKQGYLNGANIEEALGVLQTSPMMDDQNVGHTIGPHLGVNWHDQTAVFSGIATYKGLDLGVDSGPLQQACGNRNGWVLSGLTRKYNNIDHSVGVVDYATAAEMKDYYGEKYKASISLGSLAPSTPCLGLGTWGTLGIVDFASFVAITGEAWAIDGVFPPVTPPTPIDPPIPPMPPLPPPPAPTPDPVVPPIKIDWLAILKWLISLFGPVKGQQLYESMRDAHQDAELGGPATNAAEAAVAALLADAKVQSILLHTAATAANTDAITAAVRRILGA